MWNQRIPEKGKNIKKELLVALILALLCLIAWGFIELYKSRNAMQSGQGRHHAILTLGEKEQIIDLNQNGVYDFSSNNIAVHIEVKDHKAAFVRSECKDHICESYGWLSREGDLAVCLPAQAALSIH